MMCINDYMREEYSIVERNINELPRLNFNTEGP